MREIRQTKPIDQENAQRGFLLIKQVMQENDDIEPSIWASACWSIIADGYANCGFTFEEFHEELIKFLSHSKEWFKND